MKKHQFTAPVFAGHEYLLPARIRPNIAKLARFLHVLRVKTGAKKLINGYKKCVQEFDNYTYQDHLIQITPKSHNNHNFQMINDLQRRFENADNFLRVQRYTPKRANWHVFKSVGMTPLFLTAAILRGHYEGITE